MSDIRKNAVKSETAYLKSSGRGFSGRNDVVLVARKHYNDIVASYMEDGRQKTMPLVRSFAGYLQFWADAKKGRPDNRDEYDAQRVDFGAWILALGAEVTAAEACAASSDIDGVEACLESLNKMARGWLEQYHIDIQQRPGFEVEEEGA